MEITDRHRKLMHRAGISDHEIELRQQLEGAREAGDDERAAELVTKIGRWRNGS